MLVNNKEFCDSKEDKNNNTDGVRLYRTCTDVGLYLGNLGHNKKNSTGALRGRYYLDQLVSIFHARERPFICYNLKIEG